MSLVLLNEQSNDSLTLYLTDTSTWGSDGIPAFLDIDSVTMTIQYETPDGLSEVYPFDAQTIFDAAQLAVDTSLLVYPITMASLGLGSGVLPDGIYTINYTVVDGATTVNMDPLGLLLDNIIKNEVYRRVGTIQYQYFANNNYYTKPIDDNLLLQSLYDSMLASAFVAKKEEIIKVLETLQRLTD